MPTVEASVNTAVRGGEGRGVSLGLARELRVSA